MVELGREQVKLSFLFKLSIIDIEAAKRFFKKALRSFHVSKPRVITVDKNPAYPIAIEEFKKEKST